MHSDAACFQSRVGAAEAALGVSAARILERTVCVATAPSREVLRTYGETRLSARRLVRPVHLL